MNKKARRKIKMNIVEDVTSLGQVNKQDLLSDFEKYDKENYNPFNNLTDKEILIPENKTEVITLRLSPQENAIIKKLAVQNGLSKSAFLRMVVTRSLRKPDFF